jgi:hypothetical protein
MPNSLAGSITAVRANVEAAHRSVLAQYLYPKPVQQLIDGAPFRLEQIELCRSVSFGYHERMQFRHRIAIADRKSECI